MNRTRTSSGFRRLGGIFLDTFFAKNIVLVQAVGLCPIIAIGINLKYGVALTLCTAAVLLPTSLCMSLWGSRLPAWLRPPVYTVGASILLLGAAAQLFKQRVDENVERHGLTNAQSRVLLYLIHVKQGTETNQRDLEKLLDVKAPTVNGIVGRMEEKGFIRRLPGKRDGRCRSITVTEKGRLLV